MYSSSQYVRTDYYHCMNGNSSLEDLASNYSSAPDETPDRTATAASTFRPTASNAGQAATPSQQLRQSYGAVACDNQQSLPGDQPLLHSHHRLSRSQQIQTAQIPSTGDTPTWMTSNNWQDSGESPSLLKSALLRHKSSVVHSRTPSKLPSAAATVAPVAGVTGSRPLCADNSISDDSNSKSNPRPRSMIQLRSRMTEFGAKEEQDSDEDLDGYREYQTYSGHPAASHNRHSSYIHVSPAAAETADKSFEEPSSFSESTSYSSKSDHNVNLRESKSLPKTKKNKVPPQFDQKFSFQFGLDNEITWGLTKSDFALSVISYSITQPNKLALFDFRVVLAAKCIDFRTTGLPSTEIVFFHKELNRIFPGIIVPAVPDIFPVESGQLGLELWFNWLGRHPVIGESAVFWHLLRYLPSKDWLKQKSAIKHVTKLTEKLEMLQPANSSSEWLEGCVDRVNFETDHAAKVEKKLLRLKFVVEDSIRLKSQQQQPPPVIKNIGDEIRNFCIVARFRQPENMACSEFFFTAGQKLSECEEKLRKELLRSVNRLKYQLAITHSIYSKLHQLLSSRDVRKSVKLLQSEKYETKMNEKIYRARMTACVVLSELNYLREYEQDILFVPLLQMLQDTHSYFAGISDSLGATLRQIVDD